MCIALADISICLQMIMYIVYLIVTYYLISDFFLLTYFF